MTTPTAEQIRQFLEHSPLRYGLSFCCEKTEHACKPDTCHKECWQAACSDLERWIKDMTEEA